jgi:hypothetical protein
MKEELRKLRQEEDAQEEKRHLKAAAVDAETFKGKEAEESE